MSRFIVLAVSGFLATAVTASPSFADEGTDHFCHAKGGVKSNNINECCYNPTRDGPTNVEAYPFCPGVLPQNNNYPTLDRTTTLHGNTCAAGVNCGPPADLTNIKPFYDTAASAPVPASVPTVVAAPPAALPPPTVIAAPAVAAPPVYAPVAALPSSGLGSPALIFAGLGALGFAGIAALASGSSSTTTTTDR